MRSGNSNELPNFPTGNLLGNISFSQDPDFAELKVRGNIIGNQIKKLLKPNTQLKSFDCEFQTFQNESAFEIAFWILEYFLSFSSGTNLLLKFNDLAKNFLERS